MMIRTIAKICSSTSSQGPQEGIDHLFLLPERVLGMDGVQLRKDLAALDFKVQLLQSAPSGNVWLSGGGNNHEVNGELPNAHSTGSQANTKSHAYNRTKDGQTQQQIDREERLRLIKEKQNEERQKKLEELKQQALAAQKFREKTEEERRRRIEDLKCRENDRRQQVEERKRLIMEAERDRREAILRRNMEREARIESKRKMERSSIVFAFGSSTPRMLEPTDSGSTYWASRRATSTTNVMSMSVASPGPLTRRSSERELANGNKKRATSAGGLLDRKNADDHRPMDSIRQVLYWDSYYPSMYSETPLLSTVNNPSICSYNMSVLVGEGKENNVDIGVTLTQQRSAARRKTDLMPTVPSNREMAPSSTVSRNSSVCSSRRSPGSRSGETTPRPQSALSQQSSSGGTGSTRPRPTTAPSRKQRPISIAVTGVTSSIDSIKQNGNGGKSPSYENRPPVPKVHVTKKYAPSKTDIGRKPEKPKSAKSSVSTTPKETPLQSPTIELSTEGSFTDSESGDRSQTNITKPDLVVNISSPIEKQAQLTVSEAPTESKQDDFSCSDVSDLAECDMTGSMTSSQIRRITTEEEAKAALAERRRLAREQAEREAELEQQRLEAERLAEEERQRKEEEEQRKMEEEQLRLLEESKKAEEERLLLAIEEAKKREEEERQRKEEELKLKLEKEEAERKAKEEAEKQRQEMEMKLKKEEEDRQARRKRVEAIMSRTRAKGGTPSVTPTKENNNDIDEKINGMSSNNNNNNNNIIIKVISEDSNKNDNEQFLSSERNENGSSDTLNNKQNGVHFSVESRNVTNNLLDLTDFDVITTNMIPSATVPSQILDLPVTKDNFNSNKQDIKDLLS